MEIENGVGLKFTLYINGEFIGFTLGLVDEFSKMSGEFIRKRFVFFMDGTDKFWEYSLYSGGLTGFGIRSYDINILENFDLENSTRTYKTITKDPIEAITIFNEFKESQIIKNIKKGV
ncbi:MAG: hypothetical protein PHT94_01050 [Candidatus Nanoarchaeia archaeon]|nr:hypothetical protein [Candidatus Nanoarchaeia archaeon]